MNANRDQGKCRHTEQGIDGGMPGLTQPSPAQSPLEAQLKTMDSMGYLSLRNVE